MLPIAPHCDLSSEIARKVIFTPISPINIRWQDQENTLNASNFPTNISFQ
jgi:hypothetical protein